MSMFDRERQQEVIGVSDKWTVIEFLGRNLGDPTNLYGKDEIMILTDYLIEEMVRELKRIFGENIQQIILFGSTARMDDEPDSDIDIAVILRQELSHDKRVEFLEWSAEFDMKYGIPVRTCKGNAGCCKAKPEY